MEIFQRFFIICLLFWVNINNLSAAENELVILNWHGYLAPKVIKTFEVKYQTHLKIVNFRSRQERDEILRQRLEDFDLTVVSGNEISKYKTAGWIQVLDKQKIPNLQHLMRRWLWQPENAKLYAIPYAWGHIGIAYRQDKLVNPPTTWQALLQPKRTLYKRILMASDIHELMGVALKAAGYSANETDFVALQQAEELLLQQKIFVNTYGMPELDKNHALVSGKVWLAMTLNGNTLNLAKLNKHIKYITPKEGCLLLTDYWVVLSKTKNKQLATRFINFLQNPAVAAETALTLNCATPNKAAFAFLPASHRNNSNIYPPADVIARSEFLQVSNPEVIHRYVHTLSLLAK